MNDTTVVPEAIQAALADPLLNDALANVLDTLVRLRRQGAACQQMAAELTEHSLTEPYQWALDQAAALARSRAALGDTLTMTADLYEEPFAGTALDGENVPDGDWGQALGDPDLRRVLVAAAERLLALKARARAHSIEEWVLRYIAEEPYDAPA